MKMAVMLAQDEGYTFFSGPTFFLGLIIICFLLMVTTAVREWLAKRTKDGHAQEESDVSGDATEAVNGDTIESKSEKKQAAREAKQRKKEAKEANKKEKAAAKAEAKAAKAAKKAKKKKK